MCSRRGFLEGRRVRRCCSGKVQRRGEAIHFISNTAATPYHDEEPWSTTMDDWIGYIYKTTYITKLGFLSETRCQAESQFPVKLSPNYHSDLSRSTPCTETAIRYYSGCNDYLVSGSAITCGSNVDPTKARSNLIVPTSVSSTPQCLKVTSIRLAYKWLTISLHRTFYYQHRRRRSIGLRKELVDQYASRRKRREGVLSPTWCYRYCRKIHHTKGKKIVHVLGH